MLSLKVANTGISGGGNSYNLYAKFDNIGHLMKYDLDENDGKTRVRYSYEGFSEIDDSYANMNYSSAKYLESLRQYCQAGKGEAFGSPSYRS